MNIGVPREIMDKEYRVGVIPAGVNSLVKAGHRVFVEKTAGAGSGLLRKVLVLVVVSLMLNSNKLEQR